MSTTEYRLPKSRDWLIIDDVGDEPTPEDVKRAYQQVEDAMMSIPVRGSALRANCFYEMLMKEGELHINEVDTQPSRPVILHPKMTDMIALAKEIGMPHELSRPILTAAQVMEFKANTARYVLRPTYVGGKEWYGDPMTLARERILFVTALIRIIRP